ncbi:hypothetical protein TNCV_4082791 [Trichonephila clavipes]|nr:hypothetical protein TNCV_4082791 [Trichonephila clavipes]
MNSLHAALQCNVDKYSLAQGVLWAKMAWNLNHKYWRSRARDLLNKRVRDKNLPIGGAVELRKNSVDALYEHHSS